MAKKAQPTIALEFVFEGAALQGLLDSKPKKVLFTVTVETAVTKDNKKVGALKIVAQGVGGTGAKTVRARANEVVGCPVPPCGID
jgi:hypothetical protein